MQGKYVFDQLGRLKEVMTVFTEANDSVSSCHTYYNYDNNINYQANLNLQAYVIDYDGVDSFFYFLLNLGQLRNRTALPLSLIHIVPTVVSPITTTFSVPIYGRRQFMTASEADAVNLLVST